MKRLWEAAVSLKTTAILLSVLFVLLLFNVVFTQAARDPAEYARAVRSSAWAAFVLGTLGLGNVVTGLPFITTLVLFFVNLAAVLVDRVASTVRRIRFAPPTPAQVEALFASKDAARAGLDLVPPVERVEEVLQILGYRTARVAGGGVWGVRNRFALLGFPVFHASFFLLCAGGLQLYLTRSVVTLLAAEGQTVSTLSGPVLRTGPLLAPLDSRVRIERVDVRLADGKPLQLSARLLLADPGVSQVSRVNRPATWGDLTVLVQRAGIAPVLWLQDRRGYTLDRVVVPVSDASGLPTRIRLAGGSLEAVVENVPVGPGFPHREALSRFPVPIRLKVGETTTFDGVLRPGEAVEAGDLTLVLDEVRYWVGLRLVRERGGGLLIAGFALAVAGIAWRMAWYRREVVVTWAEPGLRIAGRAEFVAARASDDVLDISRLLSEPSGRGRLS